MNSNKDKINSLPIIDVLNKLGYHEGTHYKIVWNNIRMFDSQWKVSDWWIGSISQNRLFCKSWLKSWRFEWDIIWIIKWAKNIEAWEAITWAENAFNINKVSFKAQKNSLWDKWNKLPPLNDEQISFLKERGIEYNKYIKAIAKNNNWAISSPIKSEWWNINAIQSRRIWNVDKKFRYQIEKDWEDGSWIFMSIPKPDEKRMYVVEGMTDLYTIAQFWENVIWIVSATAWVQYIKAFDTKYNLIYIPDNDEAWLKSVEAFDKNKIKYSKFSLSKFGDNIGDVNDAWKMATNMWLDWKAFLEKIYNWCERPLTNIELALRKAIRNRDVWSWKTGDKVFDEATWWITPWSVMIINGLSWEGKTTTVDWIITSLMKYNKKIAFCSIDDDVGKMLAMFLGRHFRKNWIKEIYPEIEKYVDEYWRDKFDNFLLYDNINNLEWFEQLIKEENLDILIIDYIQVIENLPWKDMQAKMLAAIRGLQRLSIDMHVAIICLSQVAKWEDQKPVLYRTPMESQYIKSAWDTFINVWIYGWKHKIAFIKNKYWNTKYKQTEHDTYWDEKTGKISIFADFDTISENSRKM